MAVQARKMIMHLMETGTLFRRDNLLKLALDDLILNWVMKL